MDWVDIIDAVMDGVADWTDDHPWTILALEVALLLLLLS